MGGAPTIVGEIRSKTNFDGSWDNVFVEFNDELFYAKNEPDNTRANDDEREAYSLTFYSERFELDNVYMIDAVQEDSDVDGYQSNSTKVQFMGNIDQWAARLNASFEYSGLSLEGWSVVVDSGVTSEDKFVSFEDKFISEALQDGFTAFGIPYYFAGKTIHFGYSANTIQTPFEYGVDNSLLSIQRTNANYKIVNRCSGYGSSENIPYYYPNTSPKGSVTAVADSTNVGIETDDIVVFNAERFANKVSVTDSIKYIEHSLTFSFKGVKVYDEDDEEYTYRSLQQSDTVSLLAIFSSYRAYVPMKMIVYANASAYYTIAFPVRINGVVRSISSLTDVVLDNASAGDALTLDKANSSVDVYLTQGTHTITLTAIVDFPYDSNIGGRTLWVNWSASSDSSWYINSNKLADLSSIGVRVEGTPTSGDGFKQVIATSSYIPPVDHLMPPIFRSSMGASRFYDALNDTYPLPDGSDYYEFSHPYTEGDKREIVVSFDDIKPTIEGMKNAANEEMDKFIAFAWDDNDNDEIDPDTGEYVHPYFFAKLPKFSGTYGFNLFDCSSENGPMTISMKSGVCGACQFEIHVGEETQKNTVQVDADGNLLRNSKGEVRCGCESLKQPKEEPQERQNDTSNYEVWVALAKDTTTYPVVMPSHQRGLVPSADDNFVILNITLPQAYITAAEARLKNAIIDYMAKNNDDKFSYAIKFSRIFFEENPDVLADLNENARLLVKHHGISNTFYISKFTYTMREGDILPEIAVELVDELTATSNSLQTKIDAVKQDIMNSVGNGDILKTGLKYFLRKDVEDYALKKIHFREGATFGNYRSGVLGAGGAISIDENGNSYAEFDFITIRKKATFREIVVDKMQAVGGTVVISPGAIVISSVEEKVGYYRCYFDTVGDNGQSIENTFSIGDLARCQTFNLTKTRYYWRQVVGVGPNYVDLSKVVGQYDTNSDAPEVGDNIVALGSRTETDRRAAIVISAYGSDSPSIRMYHGISTFSLEDKDMFGIIYDVENHRPHLYNYGSMFFGQRDATANYISYNGSVMKICAKVEFASGSSGLANLNEWNTVDARITRATNTADTVAQALENLNSDDILTLSEKHSIRIEWEAINGVASTTETGTTGSYYMTKHDFDTIAWSGNPRVFIYNGVTYTYDQRAIVYNLVGINAMDAAYQTLRSYLDSMDLYEDEDTENFSRAALATKLTAMYDSERRVYDCVAQDTKTKADNSVETANNAKDKMDSWVADGVISPLEMIEINDELTFIISDFTEIVESCVQLSISYTTLQSYYNTYSDDLDDIINGTPDDYGNVSIPTNFALHQENYYEERTDVLEEIANALKGGIDDAQDTADEAHDKMDSWVADGVISPLEMAQIKDEKNFIVSDYDFCIKNAGVYGISYTSFTTAKTAYLADLNTIINGTPDEYGNVAVPTGFRTHADTYYTTRTALLASISVAIDDKYDSIDDDIADAQSAADTAQGDADAANDRMDSWLADGVLSKAELRDVKQERNFIISDNAEIVYDAGKYSLTATTQYTTYVSAYNTYYADLNNVLSGTGTYAPDEDGNVSVPVNFATHQSSYYTARTNLLKKIYDVIKDQIDAADQRAADLEFLAEAFEGTSAYISGGLILGSLIGVMNNTTASGSVVAGMNGSPSTNVGYDSTHGTLMFFAGVPVYELDDPDATYESKVTLWEGWLEDIPGSTNKKVSSLNRQAIATEMNSIVPGHEEMVRVANDLGVSTTAMVTAYNNYRSYMLSILNGEPDEEGYVVTPPVDNILTTYYITTRKSVVVNISMFKNRVVKSAYRVYRDGHVIANDIELNKGKIGGFSIQNDGIFYGSPSSETSLRITPSGCYFPNTQIDGAVKTRLTGNGSQNFISLAAANGSPIIRINAQSLNTASVPTYMYLDNGNTILNTGASGWWSTLNINVWHNLLTQVLPTTSGQLTIPSFKLYYSAGWVHSSFTIKVAVIKFSGGSEVSRYEYFTRTGLGGESVTLNVPTLSNYSVDSYYTYGVFVYVSGALKNGMNNASYINITTDSDTYGEISYGSTAVTKGVFIGANGINVSMGEYSKFMYIVPTVSFYNGNPQYDYRSAGGNFEVSLKASGNDSVGIRIVGQYDANYNLTADGATIYMNLGKGGGWKKLTVESDGTLKLT